MIGAVPLLRSETLSKAGFVHGFSTRAGGVSPPPFDTFDLAIQRPGEALSENERRLAATLGLPSANLFQAHQVHGNRVLVAGGDPVAMRAEEADALIAEPRSSNGVLVRVADCVPVLLADPSTGRVAAVHAGWPGVVARVVDAALDAMRAEGILAAMGPSIGPCCFEVGDDVAAKITSVSSPEVVVRSGDPGKVFVALRRAVRAQLLARGVAPEGIDDVGEGTCTRCDAARFYSYRRDKDASGRQVGVIVAR